MMMTFSAAAYIVDRLDPHAARPPSETEIESGSLMAAQPAEPAVRTPVLASWLGRIGWKAAGLPTGLAAGGKA